MIQWFSPSRGVPSEDLVPLTSADAKVHHSMALGLLTHQLQKDRKYHILDLGTAVGQNIEFFSQFTCKIYIEELYTTLNSFDYFSPEDGSGYEAVFEYLLPYRKNTRFDVILAWDLFNYLEREELRHLLRHLRRFFHAETLLFALISTLKHMPEEPIRFRIVDHQTLVYEFSSTVLKPCPRYQHTDLTRVMPGFRVCNSFHLRNGFREYLFLRG